MKKTFMEMKSRLPVVTGIFVLLLIIGTYACQEEFFEEHFSNEALWAENHRAIEYAMSWYDENQPETLGLRAGNGNGNGNGNSNGNNGNNGNGNSNGNNGNGNSNGNGNNGNGNSNGNGNENGNREILMKPNWKQSFWGKNDKYDVVEADLLVQGVFLFINKDCMEKFKETGDAKYKQSYTRIVFRTDRKTGETVGFLMTIVPDLQYLEKTKFKPFKKICYLNRLKDYGGWILFHNLDGSFSNGWVYEKGKVTGSIGAVNEEPVGITLRSSTCDLVDVYFELTQCRDYYSGNEEYGFHYSGELCDSWWEYGFSYWNCPEDEPGDNDNDYPYTGGGGTSGGGGGGDDPPPSIPPDNPCNSGITGNTNNNNMLDDPVISTDMHDLLQNKASSSSSEWAVSIGRTSDGTYAVSAALEGNATGGYLPAPPPATTYIASGHNHTQGSTGPPSSGDLYTFLQQVRSNPSMETMYVYGTGYYIINGTTTQIPETYAINVHDRAAVIAFLNKYPASTNLMNGLNGWVEGTDLKIAFDFAGKNYIGSGTFTREAAGLAYIMSIFNMGVTLSRKVDSNPFEVINAQQSNPTIINVATCN